MSTFFNYKVYVGDRLRFISKSVPELQSYLRRLTQADLLITTVSDQDGNVLFGDEVLSG